ncbi:hypothetical protein D9611_004682 [Ephemerocybe angulata]|uniref:J domain-containing protein n=1 Tax=Ephemerocybe angulata TaxID=980116 RepID=A0A8H5EX13_9AGAR|nr:hypothetical protein D9611_004682 [Tulosesus angulatus]
MSEDNDPIAQFFPGEEDVDLYQVLGLTNDATLDAIKKAYRRHALIYHPDKHANASEEAKADASVKFQQVGFAYAVLSDEKRKARYDKTGRTDEGFELAAGEDGWEAYFEDLFERVTRGKLDEMKKEYQGSEEEVEDLKSAYLETEGSIDEIMTYIPHSTHEDEGRFVMIITSLISKKELKSTKLWEKSIKDEKAKLARKKAGEKEAKEAEELAKELGVWEEFYGSGKATERKKGKSKVPPAEGEEDVSALQALILKKQKRNMDDLVDSLAAKYLPKPKGKGKGKKRAHEDDPEEELPTNTKKSRKEATPPEMTDEEFAKLQERLFGDKAKASSAEAPKTRNRSGSTSEAPKSKKGRAKRK